MTRIRHSYVIVPAFVLVLQCLGAGTAVTQSSDAQNGEWVSLTGTIASVEGNTFKLDYGPNLVTVKMGDFAWFKGTDRLVPGDVVTVSGRTNAALFDERVLKARRLYAYDRHSHYYAENADKDRETLVPLYPVTAPTGSFLSLRGLVEDIEGREFSLDVGETDIEVETGGMGYNPLDDVGYPSLRKGDRVQVSGTLDDDIFDNRHIEATNIVSLERFEDTDNDKGGKSGS